MRSSIVVAAALFASATAPAHDAVPLTAREAEQYATSLRLPGVTAETLAGVSVVRDAEFARYGDDSMLLDLYLPKASDTAVPCVVVIKGGGFKPANKDGFAHIAAYYAANDFASVCVSYRGAPDHPFPAAVHDTKAAVRWVRANAEKYTIDPDRIGAVGQSAGGHLAAMLAVSADIPELEGDGGNAGVSSSIQAAATWAGVFDFVVRLRDGGQQSGESFDAKRRSNAAWIGEPFSETSELWKKASPISYLTPDDPPLLLVQCKDDKTVPYQQAVQMHEAMQKLNLTSELLLMDGGGHSVSNIPGINARAWSATLAFFRAHL